MALANTIDTEQAALTLRRYLSLKFSDESLEVLDAIVPKGNGLSNDTVLFTLVRGNGPARVRQRLAARIQPRGDGVHPSYHLDREVRLLSTLHGHTKVPVPKPLWIETDPAWFGASFAVLDYVAGNVPGDDPPYTVSGWVLELDATQRADLSRNALEALAKVHEVDWRKLDLGFLDKAEFGRVGLPQEIAYIKAAYEWGRDGLAHPVIEAAFEWVENHAPPLDEPLALTWGDARIGNMIFATDCSVAAVLDWELAAIASPEMDLGWWMFLQRIYTDAVGLPLPEGLYDRAAIEREYERISGHTVRYLDFYEVFAVLRGSIQMLRVGTLMMEANLLPADSTIRVVNPTINLLASLIGVEPPAGRAETWVGNRG